MRNANVEQKNRLQLSASCYPVLRSICKLATEKLYAKAYMRVEPFTGLHTYFVFDLINYSNEDDLFINCLP